MRPTSNLRSSSDQNILSTVDYVSLLDKYNMGWWYYYLSTVEYFSTLYFFYVWVYFSSCPKKEYIFPFCFFILSWSYESSPSVSFARNQFFYFLLFINKYKGCVCVCLARRLKEFFFKKKRDTTLYLILHCLLTSTTNRPPIIYWRLLHAVWSDARLFL